MSENQYNSSNPQPEDLLSPNQNIHFTGRPPMAGGMSNPGQTNLYQQVNYALMQNNGFIRPTPYPHQHLNMLSFGRGPPNPFPQQLSGANTGQLAGQPSFQQQGINMLGGMQQNHMGLPQQHSGETVSQAATPNNQRPPPTPSTPATTQDQTAQAAVNRNSLPPSRAESIPLVPQVLPSEPLQEDLELEDHQGDRLFRECLGYFSGKETDLHSLTYWVNFVEAHFSSSARYRQRFVAGNSKDKSYEFQGGVDLIPHLLLLPFASGSLKMKFLLSTPKFKRNGSYLRISYDSSEIFSQYENSWTISKTSLCVVFDGDRKIAAWDCSSLDCLEYLSRPVLEQLLFSQKPNSGTPGRTNSFNTTLPDLLTVFPPHSSENSAPKKLLEKLECLNAVNILTPLVEIQRTLKRPISACCELYFNDSTQASNKAQRSSTASTPKLNSTRITPKAKININPNINPNINQNINQNGLNINNNVNPSVNQTVNQNVNSNVNQNVNPNVNINNSASLPHPPNIMSPLNPARQLAISTPHSVASPTSQVDTSQAKFTFTPNQVPNDLGDTLPSKRGRGTSNSNRGARRGRGTVATGRARKVSTPKNSKSEGP